jgi:flagellar hook-length control protein FliK
MRIFVLASLSTNVIAASNNAAKLTAKSNAADSKSATDGSPFGVMLAATTAEQVKQQPAKPVSDDAYQAAAKKSDTASNETRATKEHRDAPNAGKTNTAKEADAKTDDTKNLDAKAADAPDKITAKEAAANDNADVAAQTPQPQVQQPPIQQAQVQQAQVVPPAPQPDPSALMLTQAQAAATPSAGAAAAHDDADTRSDVNAVSADAGKASPASTTTPAGSAILDTMQAADGAAPQAPGASSNSSESSPGSFKSQLAAIKGAAGDGKTATQGSEKTASKTADTTAQPQTQQAQVTPQTPPPAAPANNDNAAAVPAPNFGTPVQNNADTTISSSIQVSAHAPDTAGTLGTLAVAIAAKTQSGARQFDIRLDPPELGHIEVRLSIDANGKTEAHMTADQPATLSLLQKDSSSLTQALRDAGLDVSQSGLNFSLRSQNGQGGGDNGGSRGARSNLIANRAIDVAQGASSTTSFSGSVNDGRLDIHV